MSLKPIRVIHFAQGLEFENAKDIARRKAIQNRYAGARGSAFPSKKNIGTLMDDQNVSICVELRLGCILCHTYQSICGHTVNVKALQPLSCIARLGRFFSHAEINNIKNIKRALANISIPAQLEPYGLDRNYGKTPDGTTITP